LLETKASVLREVTPEAIAEVRAIIRDADHAALAVIEPGTGHPLASRVGFATLADGTPLIVISRLAAHTTALDADARCSLLVGTFGKGDPLAGARVTLVCRARVVLQEAVAEARTRYLASHPRAAIYVDLPDFRFFRLEILRASFNGGFGRAYTMDGAALVG
jgi:putative heme iron utilization protein